MGWMLWVKHAIGLEALPPHWKISWWPWGYLLAEKHSQLAEAQCMNLFGNTCVGIETTIWFRFHTFLLWQYPSSSKSIRWKTPNCDKRCDILVHVPMQNASFTRLHHFCWSHAYHFTVASKTGESSNMTRPETRPFPFATWLASVPFQCLRFEFHWKQVNYSKYTSYHLKT